MCYHYYVTRRGRPRRPTGWVPSELPAKNPIGELELVTYALNGTSLFSGEDDYAKEETVRRHDKLLKETPPILRDLVMAWQQSGPNLARFSLEWSKAWAGMTYFMKTHPVKLAWGKSGGCGFVKTYIDRLAPTPTEEAYRWFCLLITNSEWARLAGPCERCRRYYVRRTARNKKYCSRSCGTHATAVAATQKRREQEHRAKLQRASKAAQQWITARSALPWKRWVAMKEPDIKVNFLTRAVNRGEIAVPIRTS